jgi:predicted branched-subunit amino acid permease
MERDDFYAGVKAMSPILLGVIPFGILVGVTGVNAGIHPLQVWAMSWIYFAGASQLVAIDLIGRNAPVAVVVLTVLIVNLRMAMYSASLAPFFHRFSSFWKWICAYLLTDQAYAVSINEFNKEETRNRRWFYLGGALTLWLPWQIVTITGIIIGTSLPGGLSLEFAVPLTFMALLFPALVDTPTKFAALVAGIVSVLSWNLPYNLGLIIGALAGIAAGVVIELRRGTQ